MEIVGCNICGSRNGEFVLTVSDCIESSVTYQLIRCKNCDLTFVSPRPEKVDFRKYYPPDSYYAHQDNSAKGVDQKLKQKVKSYFMEWAGGYRPEGHKAVINKRMSRIIMKIIKNHLIGVVPSKFKGKLLDVGCGKGDLMTWYQNRGWETTGIEPSLKAAGIAEARGLKIVEAPIEEAHLLDNYFDAVTMVQVLEHLKDPKSVLNKLHRALRPGGLLVAGVPNFLCFDRRIIGNAWIPLEVPRHLYHFTPKSLQNLFKSVGFSIIEIRQKTIYKITLSQINQIRRLKPGLKCVVDIAYILVSPFVKMLIPKDFSSTFISIYATKSFKTF
jgi:2-polyprenyl-3-methyl-5-hydroxy-6-metoxy-1,4-benzoquinol methylase